MYFGAGTIAATEATLGRKVAIHLTYYAWNDDWTRGNTASDLAANRIPLVNWEPQTPNLDDIVAGTYDAMLHSRAVSAKALVKPFFLDWGAEMNGSWSPWSGANYGNTTSKYVAAYKHIHDIFTSDGATNVVWAWCPNVEDDPHVAWNLAMNYYPGDGYVDWTCVDGYNWGTTNGNGWQTFAKVFAGIYPLLAAKGKPILIGETASTELGGNKAEWIAAIVPALKSTFPLIRAFAWFDVNKETDWRFESSTASRDAFILMAKDPYLNP
jgi:beta-mannanase